MLYKYVVDHISYFHTKDFNTTKQKAKYRSPGYLLLVEYVPKLFI